VKQRAAAAGLPVIQPRRVKRPAFAESLRDTGAELLVVVAYGRILPRAVLDAAPRGAVNVHFSLLPKYRGAAPVQWALARGESVTGVTTMQIDEALDEGDVLRMREVEIEPGEHAPQLSRRLGEVGAELLVETVAALARDELQPRPQDHTQATYAPILEREHGHVDPSLAAREIEGRIRGFDPWPGVWVRKGKKRLRLLDGEARSATDEAGAEDPGRVLALEDEALIVACGHGTRLALRALQAEGRRAVDARDAVNGRLLQPGDLLEGVAAT
jgi:methionyl-tRNA formyltransferase